MVGDSPFDVTAARDAGLKTIAVLTGGFSSPELREAGAACVFTSIVELASPWTKRRWRERLTQVRASRHTAPSTLAPAVHQAM